MYIFVRQTFRVLMAIYQSFRFQFILQSLGNMILVSVTNYWLLVPTFLMSLLFYKLRQIYVKTGRCVKRVESLSK